MRRVVRFVADELIAPERDVLRRIEMPANVHVASALRAILDDSEQRIHDLIQPVGVIQEIAADEFLTVYRGEGRNAAESPLPLIVPRAKRLAIFAGTLGDTISQQIAMLLREGDAASAMVLDAYASETANRLAYALSNDFGDDVLPYSPGYCGWHVSGQRALFDVLQPADIGITINASCLMTPIKSLSGVLVSADAAAHQFRPAFAFCDECSTQECVPRMRSMVHR
ncbi:MAG TPA: hypothetical protein VLU46_02875 [Thermoanaerobaculia bacterium]|nr:hypothetical protein [Thermoanaerobaculia bacterium]